jgi:hypothetical protein
VKAAFELCDAELELFDARLLDVALLILAHQLAPKAPRQLPYARRARRTAIPYLVSLSQILKSHFPSIFTMQAHNRCRADF